MKGISSKVKFKMVTFRLPEYWIAIVDQLAERRCVTRTQIIKDWIKSKCLKP